MVSRYVPSPVGCLEPDQTPGVLIGHVPCQCNHCVEGCQYSFAPVPYVPISSPPVEEEGGEGAGEGHQACSAAQTLQLL